MRGRVGLPVGAYAAHAALEQAVESHHQLEVRRHAADAVDVVGRVKDRRGEEKVRFTVHSAPGGTSELEHGAWGLRGVGSEELYDAVVDDVAERVRGAAARALAEADPAATGAYVGTLVGARNLDLAPGRPLAVLFGPDQMTLRHGETVLVLAAEELLEVEAVPTSTPGLPLDAELLAEAVAHASVGTVLGVATDPATDRECLVHLGGSTTSVVNAELYQLRGALRPARVPVVAGSSPSAGAAPRRTPGGKLSAIELVREMAALAQLHHEGGLDEDEYALAKAELLGIS